MEVIGGENLKKIVLVNAHWSNRGDEAAIRAIVDSILENVLDAQITIVFKETGDVCQFPYVDRVDYITAKFLPKYWNVRLGVLSKGKLGCNSEMKKIVETIDGADLVVYAPGGAVVSDRFWWKKQLEYLFPIAYAQRKKIPVFFAAPSIGPFKVKRRYRDNILKKADAICIREEISYNELEKEGLAEKARITIDSAFLNDIDTARNEEILNSNIELKQFLNKYQKIIGITITDLGWHVEYRKEEGLKERIDTAFTEFIHNLKEDGTGVVLIPQLFGNQNDREYLKAFQTENTFLLGDDLDTYFQQYIISKMYGVVGMRYHSNIFAAKMGVPFIPVIYEEKMEGFVKSAGWEKLSLKVKELSEKELMNKYEYLDKNHECFSDTLKKNRQEWKCKAEQTRDGLLRLLE